MCKQKEEGLKETKNHNIEASRKAFESMELIKNRRRIVRSKEENKKGRKKELKGLCNLEISSFRLISTSNFFLILLILSKAYLVL